ncbi:MAG: glyoxylate/hydroxypyruvate reductase A [Burkholderiales bacterium]|nr:glyoxylate/hydroxypyruvate reductase A [Burkholderiales bacterium]
MLYVYSPRDQDAWRAAFARHLPHTPIAVYPDVVAPEAVTHIAAWQPPADFFTQFPNLQAAFALGAGVDRFLAQSDLPVHIPLYRLTDAGMAPQMLEYVLYGVLYFQRDFDHYAAMQAQHTWDVAPPRLAGETRVTVLGLGEIGGYVAKGLAALGYRVAGWSRSSRELAGVDCRHGLDALPGLFAQTDILVSLLPSTPQTRGLLDAARFAQLPQGAALINAARGDQVDEDALLAALGSGHLRGALLDVFATEPLPTESQLWSHPRVRITPHIAAATLRDDAAKQIAERLAVLAAGGSPSGQVDRVQSY